MINGGIPVVGGVGGLLAVSLWLAVWSRVAGTGVFVSGTHVTVRRVFTTKSVELWRVTTVGAITIRGGARRQLVLNVNNGHPVFAPLRGYVAGRGDDASRPDVLSAADFDLVLADIRQRAAAAPSRPPSRKPPKAKRSRREKAEPKPPVGRDEPKYPPGTVYRRD
jgi:hypothetical protein